MRGQTLIPDRPRGRVGLDAEKKARVLARAAARDEHGKPKETLKQISEAEDVKYPTVRGWVAAEKRRQREKKK